MNTASNAWRISASETGLVRELRSSLRSLSSLQLSALPRVELKGLAEDGRAEETLTLEELHDAPLRPLWELLGGRTPPLRKTLDLLEWLIEPLAALSERGLHLTTLSAESLWVTEEVKSWDDLSRERLRLTGCAEAMYLQATAQPSGERTLVSHERPTSTQELLSRSFSSGGLPSPPRAAFSVAPEQLSSSEPEEASCAVYRLAVVAYELITGELPFEASDPGRLTQVILSVPPHALYLPREVTGAGVCDALNDLLGRALSKSPAARPTWLQLHSGLQQLRALHEAHLTTQRALIINSRYELVSELGRGGFGVVYKALDLNVARREVAVKRLHLTATSAPEESRSAYELFEREVKVLSRLRHPNTLSVLDYGQAENGDPYMVSELLVGKTLSAYLRESPQRRLPPEAALAIILEVSEALEEAHALGVIHRDIKPDNIFILSNMSKRRLGVKLLDFGIAKLRERTHIKAQRNVTLTHGAIGTPNYMAPEQFDETRPLDHRCDLYSLGLVLYEMLEGRRAFVGDSLFAIWSKQQRDPLPPLALQLSPELSRELNALLSWMTAKDPRDRAESAELLSERLERLLSAARGRAELGARPSHFTPSYALPSGALSSGALSSGEGGASLSPPSLSPPSLSPLPSAPLPPTDPLLGGLPRIERAAASAWPHTHRVSERDVELHHRSPLLTRPALLSAAALACVALVALVWSLSRPTPTPPLREARQAGAGGARGAGPAPDLGRLFLSPPLEAPGAASLAPPPPAADAQRPLWQGSARQQLVAQGEAQGAAQGAAQGVAQESSRQEPTPLSRPPEPLRSAGSPPADGDLAGEAPARSRARAKRPAPRRPRRAARRAPQRPAASASRVRSVSLSIVGGLMHKPGARVRLNTRVDPPGAQVSYKLSPPNIGVVRGGVLRLAQRSFQQASLQACAGQVCSERVSFRVMSEDGPID